MKPIYIAAYLAILAYGISVAIERVEERVHEVHDQAAYEEAFE